MRSDLVDLTLQRHAETAKAILVSDDGDEKKAVWLAKSQVEIEHKRLQANIVIVTLPEWLATQKGFL